MPCRPGMLINVGGATATLCCYFRRGAAIFGVTAGHACVDRIGARVTFPWEGIEHELGVVHSAVHNTNFDVGVFEVTEQAAMDWAPEPDFAIGVPFPLQRTEAVPGPSCTVFLGFQRKTIANVASRLGHKLIVGASIAGVEGESGSPAYVDGPPGWQLIGQFLGWSRPREGAQHMLFEHPALGLAHLGFSFG